MRRVKASVGKHSDVKGDDTANRVHLVNVVFNLIIRILGTERAPRTEECGFLFQEESRDG